MSNDAEVGSLSLSQAIREYLEDLTVNRRSTTVNRAEQILKEFQSHVGEITLAEIDKAVLNSFLAARRVAANGNRTLWNKVTRVLALLRHHGIKLQRVQKPRYTEAIPQIYSDTDLETFFRACNARQECLFRLLLTTGVRMQEAKFLEWSDLADGLLHVRPHPPIFTPKTCEERKIPLTKGMQDLLRRLPHHPRTPFVFPTKGGSPDRHLLRHCKRIAVRAGLDPAKWSLHGFRRTYCTKLLRSGMDARSVMSLMGHASIDSTLRYWKPLEVESLRDKVSQVFD